MFTTGNRQHIGLERPRQAPRTLWAALPGRLDTLGLNWLVLLMLFLLHSRIINNRWGRGTCNIRRFTSHKSVNMHSLF